MLNTSSHTSSRRPQGLWRHHQLIGFLSAFFLAGTAFGMSALMLPVYAVSLDAPTWIVGMIQAALMLGLLLTVLPAGFIADRFGSRRLYIFSSIALGAVVAAIPLISRPIFLLPIVLLMGALGSFNSAAANTAFLNRLNQIGRERAGWQKGAWTVGISLLGPLLAGYIMRTFGYPAVFNVIAVAWVAQGVAAYLLTSGRLLCRGRTSSRSGKFSQMRHLVSDRPLVGAAALEGICAATISTFSTFVTVMIVRKLDLGVGSAAFVISLQGIGYALMLFGGAGRVGRFSRVQMRILGFGGSAAAFAVFAVSPNIVWVAAGALVLGLAVGLLSLTNVAPLAESSSARGPLVGFYGMGLHTFAFAGVLAAGFTSQAGGLTAVFWGVPALFLALALGVLIAAHMSRIVGTLAKIAT